MNKKEYIESKLQSEYSLAEICKENNLNYANTYYWCKKNNIKISTKNNGRSKTTLKSREKHRKISDNNNIDKILPILKEEKCLYVKE